MILLQILNFDMNAGRPVHPKVIEEMLPYMSEKYGNPSSLHALGREAKMAVEISRKKIASLINAESNEIIITSCATESNNLAIKGAALKYRKKGKKIVISSIEHVSVLKAAHSMKTFGFEVIDLPVTPEGIVPLDEVEKNISEDTIIISVMYANNETGVIQNIKEIADIAHEKNVLFHTDAVSAVGWENVDVKKLEIDMMTYSSNDIYGPKGVAALYVRKGVHLTPLIDGGGQERGFRSGSENVPCIVGFGKACEIAKSEMDIYIHKVKNLRENLEKKLTENIRHCYINGKADLRVPQISSIRFLYVEGESLILALDMEGIKVASGSACTSKTLQPSHVLTAMGVPHEEVHGTLIFSLGRETSEENIERICEVLPKVVKSLREMSPIAPKEI